VNHPLFPENERVPDYFMEIHVKTKFRVSYAYIPEQIYYTFQVIYDNNFIVFLQTCKNVSKTTSSHWVPCAATLLFKELRISNCCVFVKKS